MLFVDNAILSHPSITNPQSLYITELMLSELMLSSRNSQVRSILQRMLGIIEFRSRTESSSSSSVFSVESVISEMFQDRNIHLLTQDSELDAIFGLYPVNQNITEESDIQEKIKRMLAQRNLGGWLFNIHSNNNMSLNDTSQLNTPVKRLTFATVIAKSWTSLVVRDGMTAENISRITARAARIISEEINPNFEIYVSEHCLGRKMEYSIIYFQINHDSKQKVHAGVFLCKLDQWMDPFQQLMMMSLKRPPPIQMVPDDHTKEADRRLMFYHLTPDSMQNSNVASPAYRLQFATNMRQKTVTKLYYALNLQNPLFCFDCRACDIVFEMIDAYFQDDSRWTEHKSDDKTSKGGDVNWRDYSYYTECEANANARDIKLAEERKHNIHVIVKGEKQQVLLCYSKKYTYTEVSIYYFIADKKYRKFRIEIINRSTEASTGGRFIFTTSKTWK